MDAFRLCVAMGPVAIYLLLLGALSLSRHPLLVSGARDAAALALAVSGLIIAGPAELLLPTEALAQLGSYVWVLLLALYALCVALWMLLLRPRLVIYNVSVDKLRPVLADLVSEIDAGARWAGDSLVLPALGVQLYVDGFAALRGVSLVSAGSRQSYAGWRRLEQRLAAALAREEVARNPRGLLLLIAGLAGMFVVTLLIAQNPQAVTQSLMDIARSVWRMMGF